MSQQEINPVNDQTSKKQLKKEDVPCVHGPDTDGDPSTVKPAWYWIKDTRGYGSVTVTMIFISFWVTTLSYLMSIVEKLGPLTVRPFDVAACSAYFIPILTLYFGRKWTETKSK